MTKSAANSTVAGPKVSIVSTTHNQEGYARQAFDSFVAHDFSFTPSFSIWIETETEDEIERLFAALGDGGTQLMPLDDYGFSRRFGWVNDRYGVSWQLNLA